MVLAGHPPQIMYQFRRNQCIGDARSTCLTLGSFAPKQLAAGSPRCVFQNTGNAF
jgi:hypothetical protein